MLGRFLAFLSFFSEIVGFNPSYGGSCSVGPVEPFSFLMSCAFQSLLWWIMLGRPAKRQGGVPERCCFNPSYGGSCSVGLTTAQVITMLNASFNPSYGGSCSVGRSEFQ